MRRDSMEIGGYFQLELRTGAHYHSNALALNSGRNAFNYILRAKAYRKVYLPYFTCHVMQEPIKKLGVETENYHINDSFEPIFDYSRVESDEVLVYTNYFGLCDHIVTSIAGKCRNIIVDNAQSFFSRPLPEIDTFYSARKFFGVPDGAYLYIHNSPAEVFGEIQVNTAFARCEHLLKRIETGAEDGYDAFKRNEKAFTGEPIKLMSLLARRILEGIDYRYVAEQRRRNYRYLDEHLSE